MRGAPDSYVLTERHRQHPPEPRQEWIPASAGMTIWGYPDCQLQPGEGGGLDCDDFRPCTEEERPPPPLRRGYSEATTVAMSSPASVGLLPTRTPAALRASTLAAAVPRPPDTMAPAWPIFLPGGAVMPAM